MNEKYEAPLEQYTIVIPWHIFCDNAKNIRFDIKIFKKRIVLDIDVDNFLSIWKLEIERTNQRERKNPAQRN